MALSTRPDDQRQDAGPVLKHWSASFVGLPFLALGRDRAGVDCWGLVRLAYLEVLGVELPSYADRYSSALEGAEIAAALDEGRASWIKSRRPREWDVALFSSPYGPAHVGIVVSPGLMLHASFGHDSRIERYDAPHWRARLMGVYRHHD